MGSRIKGLMNARGTSAARTFTKVFTMVFALPLGVGLTFTVLAMVLTGCVSTGPVGDRGPGETIRALVIEEARHLTIDGAKLKSTIELGLSPAGELIIIDPKAGSTPGMAPEPISGPLRFYPDLEFVYVNNKPYRGIVEVRALKGTLKVVNELLLEDYIGGIINNEISSKWPLEAVKAQAVIARTYALYRKKEREGTSYYDVASTFMDQVYTGAGAEDNVATGVVRETYGEVLFFGNTLALTLYHSNAGGITESSEEVWGEYHSYLRSIKSRHDKGAPNYFWELSLTDEEFGKRLTAAGHNFGRLKRLKIARRSGSGRVKQLVLKDRDGVELTLTGEDLRRALGYATLRSTLFKVKVRGQELRITGYGSGHGVGLSQWGAKSMAEDGYGYKKILRHYYKGTKLKRLY